MPARGWSEDFPGQSILSVSGGRFAQLLVMPPDLDAGGDMYDGSDENRENRESEAARMGLRKAGKEDSTQQATPE